MHDSIYDSVCSVAAREREEGGYALLALLVAMAILMILLTAAAPVLKFEAQRERELEAIRRGEQVAEAIKLYVLQRRTLPTSIEQLEEGLSVGTKKRYILRRSSLRDPLTDGGKGEWQLVSPTERKMQRFAVSVIEYGGGQVPSPANLPPGLQGFHNLVVSTAAGGGVLGSLRRDERDVGDDEDADVDADVGNTSKPFIGVASRSTGDSIINYYGIGKHNRVVFTPLFR